MKLKIASVEPLPPARLKVLWQGGKTSTVDVSDYFRAPGHDRLRDPTLFSSVRADEWGHGIEWPQIDVGIPADALYRLSKEQSGDAYPTADFNQWMKRNGLSLAGAAEALHLTRRTIIYYSTGAKPIPVYIGLACTGWESIRRPRASAAKSKSIATRRADARAR